MKYTVSEASTDAEGWWWVRYNSDCQEMIETVETIYSLLGEGCVFHKEYVISTYSEKPPTLSVCVNQLFLDTLQSLQENK